jgi:hypothetical protein
VQEIRRDRVSNILFMPQYAQPWKHRLMQSTMDAIRDYPDFPQGSRNWDERAYHPDAHGVVRPLREIWPRGRAPFSIHWGMKAIQMLGKGPVSGGLRIAWNSGGELRRGL